MLPRGRLKHPPAAVSRRSKPSDEMVRNSERQFGLYASAMMEARAFADQSRHDAKNKAEPVQQVWLSPADPVGLSCDRSFQCSNATCFTENMSTTRAARVATHNDQRRMPVESAAFERSLGLGARNAATVACQRCEDGAGALEGSEDMVPAQTDTWEDQRLVISRLDRLEQNFETTLCRMEKVVMDAVERSVFQPRIQVKKMDPPANAHDALTRYSDPVFGSVISPADNACGISPGRCGSATVQMSSSEMRAFVGSSRETSCMGAVNASRGIASSVAPNLTTAEASSSSLPPVLGTPTESRGNGADTVMPTRCEVDAERRTACHLLERWLSFLLFRSDTIDKAFAFDQMKAEVGRYVAVLVLQCSARTHLARRKLLSARSIARRMLVGRAASASRIYSRHHFAVVDGKAGTEPLESVNLEASKRRPHSSFGMRMSHSHDARDVAPDAPSRLRKKLSAGVAPPRGTSANGRQHFANSRERERPFDAIGTQLHVSSDLGRRHGAGNIHDTSTAPVSSASVPTFAQASGLATQSMQVAGRPSVPVSVSYHVPSEKEISDCVEFHFHDLDFHDVDHTAFKNMFFKSLRASGATKALLKALRVRLRAGSIIAEVHGRPAEVGDLRSVVVQSSVIVFGSSAQLVDAKAPVSAAKMLLHSDATDDEILDRAPLGRCSTFKRGEAKHVPSSTSSRFCRSSRSPGGEPPLQNAEKLLHAKRHELWLEMFMNMHGGVGDASRSAADDIRRITRSQAA